MNSRRTFVVATLATAGACLIGSSAKAMTDQQDLVERAMLTIKEARHDPQFGNSRELLRRARAVLVVPQLVKGGFFVGGEGGNGVLLARLARGWSPPAFYVLASASFGLQIGLEVNQVMMFIMTEKALRALQQDEVKLGANAGLTVLVIGSNAQAATAMNGSPDIFVWAKSKGAYGGITLEGSVVKPRNDWDAAYYGRRVSSASIIAGTVAPPRNSMAIRESLAG